MPWWSAPTGHNRSWQRREQSRLANSTGLIVIGEIAPEPRGFRRGLVAEHGPTRKRASRLMRSDRTLARRGGRALIAPSDRLRPRRPSAIAHTRAPPHGRPSCRERGWPCDYISVVAHADKKKQ